MTGDKDIDVRLTPNWQHVCTFLGLTFGLTWVLALAIYLHGGITVAGAVPAMQLQMLLPAFSAIVLGMFFFRRNPLYHRRPVGHGRWFYYYMLLLTFVYALGVVGLWVAPTQSAMMLVSAVVPELVAVVGFFVLVVLRFTMDHEARAQVWLSWGGWRYWLLMGLGFAAFYTLQAALNAYFGLGPAHLAPVVAPPGVSPAVFQLLALVQSVLLAPFLYISIAFGEEYGWRGYLQSELMKLGRVKGVLLVGVIWGVWHWPLILMGWSYPGYPLVGLLLTVLFTTGLAIVLGYAVLKTSSVVLSAYLHALNNQVTAFIVFLGFLPFDPVFSFGVGIYAIPILAVIALLVLRDPVWRGKGSTLYQPTPI